MKFHIVGTGETIEEILENYDMSFSELKKENKHIRSWNYLVPGTKLKIPVITETMNEEINVIEPFIEDYYPKIKIENESYEEIKTEEEQTIETNELENTQENIIEQSKDLHSQEDLIIEEPDKKQEKMEEVIKHQNNNIRPLYNYPYLQFNPYYPIIYVIPRTKR